MAKPTSSSSRSKRKTTKPVTSDKGRKNRSKASTAKTTSSQNRPSKSGARVTNAAQRTSTGSARVTGTSRQALPAKSSASDLQRLKTASKTKPTRPAPRPVPKTKMTGTSGKPVQMGANNWPKGTESWADKSNSGQRGGALVPQGTRRSRAEAKASNAAKGSTGPNRVGRSDARPALPPGKRGGAMTRASAGGALARTASNGARGAGRFLGPFGTALAIPPAIKNIKDVAERNKRWAEYKERMGMNQKPNSTNRRGQGSGNKPRSTDMKPKADWRDKVSSSNVDKLRQGQKDTIRSYAGKTPAAKPKPQPKAPARTSERASAPSRTSSSSRTSSAPAKPRFKGSVDEGRRIWAEKYSSSKYDGQAIQKEAKKLLDEMKKRKSGASKAGWDGNKNY